MRCAMRQTQGAQANGHASEHSLLTRRDKNEVRYIELKELQTRKNGQSLNYRQQIALIVGEVYETNQGQRQGFDRETNKRALRILDALDEQGGDTLALEDA